VGQENSFKKMIVFNHYSTGETVSPDLINPNKSSEVR
jgi:hypothetical protein